MERNRVVVGRFLAIAAAALLAVLLPLKYAAGRVSAGLNNEVILAVNRLSNSVRISQELTMDDYSELVSFLQKTGSAYKVSITLGRTLAILDEEYETAGGGGAGLMLLSEQTPAARGMTLSESSGAQTSVLGFQSHTHTDDCYRGHNHLAAGCYVHVCTGSCYSERYSPDAVTFHPLLETGGDSGSSVENCVYCHSGCTRFMLYYACPECGQTATGWRTACGASNIPYQHSVKGGYVTTRTCGFSRSGAYYLRGTKTVCSSSEDNSPVCDEIVVSVMPSEENQTLYSDEQPDTRIIATFLDGHTEVICCTLPEYDAYKYGVTQSVTLSFPGYLMSGKNYTLISCAIGITIIQRSAVCSVCRGEYSLGSGGEDEGCPYCGERLLGIRAELQRTEYKLYEELEARVYASYQDGEVLLDAEAWTDTFDSSIEGEQQVTFVFGDMTFTATVNVVNKDIYCCEMCGGEYDTGEYIECPYCRHTISGIKAELRDNVPIIQGNPLLIDVYALYLSGERELLENGFTVSGYEPYVTGSQIITVEYGGFLTELCVQVVSGSESVFGSATCEEGHTYIAGDDSAGEGCPHCRYLAGLEEITDFMEFIYTDELLAILYSERKVILGSGDMMSISVEKTAESVIDRLGAMVLGYVGVPRRHTAGFVI